MQEARDDAADNLDGGPDDDTFGLSRFPFGPVQGGDVMQGGPGVDSISVIDVSNAFFGAPNASVRITLADGIANDGFFAGPGQPALDPAQPPVNLLGIEDVDTSGTSGGSDDFVRGTPESNLVDTGFGNDDVNGLGGPDSIFLGEGTDTVEARDGFGDRVDCGPGADNAHGDQLDELAECESVTRMFFEPFGTGTGPPGVPPPPPSDTPAATPALSTRPAAAPTGASPDRTAPACTATVKRSIRSRDLRGGIAVTGSCNETSALEVTLTGVLRGVRHPSRLRMARAGEITLAQQSLSRQEGARTVRLKVSRRLRRALGRSARLQLRLEATDAAGNRSVTSTGIRFRR